jgi:hypothetical protein
VELEPGKLEYRMETANVLLQMERGKDAVTVIRNALHLASSPQETAMAESFLEHAEEYARAQEQNRRYMEQTKTGEPAAEDTSQVAEADIAADSAGHDQALPTGPHHFVTGVLRDVHCNAPTMDLSVVSGGKPFGLHTNNYFEVEYSVLNVTLKGDLKPCADLEGRPAKVEYVDSASGGRAAVVAIELHK